jgi:hypothetical protein
MGVFAQMARARLQWSLLLAAGAFAAGLAPLSDGDLWWHLAAGREMARTHAFLMTDPFSAGAAGRPWIDVHWLFQLVAYGVYRLGGLRALVLGKCALVAAGALLLDAAVVRAAGRRAQRWFVPAFLAALFAARGLLLVRPIIPTLVFLAAFFFLLESFRRDGRAAWLAPLPLLQLAWANVQALAMLGPALVACAAAGALVERRASRALLVVLALCVAACFGTPYGARGVALSFSLLGRLWPGAANVYSANVVENVPPWVVAQTEPGRLGHVSVVLAAILLGVGASPRFVTSRVLVVLGLAALALASNRNVLLLYWLGTPIAVVSAAPTLRRLRVALLRRRRAASAAARWAPRLALAAVLLVASGAAARETTLSAPAPWRAPIESARVIRERGVAGPIFAADQFGGYLIWQLGPDHRPYMDTRLVLRSRQEFEEYLAVVDDPRRFEAWEQDKGFAYALLPVEYPERYLPLVSYLYASPRWSLVYTDGAETLFARRPISVGEMRQADGDGWNLGSSEVVDRIDAYLARRFGGEPRVLEAARGQLATLLLAVGEPVQAERALAALATPEADALRARCRYAAGDLDGAARFAETSLARDASDVRSLDVLALVAARKSDSTRARQLLRRALEIDPYDAEAGRLLTRWEGQ